MLVHNDDDTELKKTLSVFFYT